MNTRSTALFATALALSPTLAHAHPGHAAVDFAGGFAHPLLGPDHLLAMLAVGLWAAQLGGRARWFVPAAFVSVMTLGAALGMTGAHLPLVEQGIIASVLVLGVLIAAAARLPLAASVALVGVFALFHGFAHGAEMPASANGLGFVLATAALHAVGLALGATAGKFARIEWVRFAGAAMAVTAVFLIR